MPILCRAQQIPDAPEPATATISGVITDVDGDVIPGAHITLTLERDSVQKEATADGDGRFGFSHLPPGGFTLTVTATNFAAEVKTGILRPGEQYTAPTLTLDAATNESVQVTLSPREQAEAEVKAEEHQRLAGVLPNYFVTYNWHAAPLSTKQKFELAWKTQLDPVTFLVTGAIAGVEQAQNDFSGYGQGAKGYGKRYAAAFADASVGNFVGGAVLPTLLRQDPRYFYMGSGSVRRRLSYALAAAVICRGDNGRWQPNYSGVIGDFASGAISNLYYPAANRSGAGLTIENGVLGVVGDAIGNVIQEFAFRHITPHLPPAAPDPLIKTP